MKLVISLITSIVFFLAALFLWEAYWRSRGYVPDLDDDKSLWAAQREKVDKYKDSDVILLGSSRVLFDIQLDVWEKQTGKRPLMLASPGSSPLPVLQDIVENSDFNGTLVVGVTEGIFFSTTYPEAFPWKRPQSKVDHFHNRTYAQKLNHFLSLPFQENFVFVAGNEENFSDNIDLKSLLSRIKVGNRIQEGEPPFFNFAYAAEDRNTRMSERTVNDTAFANTIKKVWLFFSKAPPPDKDGTTAFFLNYAKQFEARGGEIILLRCPSSGILRQGENMAFPRARFWDSLVVVSGYKSYHFEDYPSLKDFNCPEDSHLSGPDGDKFTARLLDILEQDQLLSYKTR